MQVAQEEDLGAVADSGTIVLNGAPLKIILSNKTNSFREEIFELTGKGVNDGSAFVWDYSDSNEYNATHIQKEFVLNGDAKIHLAK